ncbi:MAG: hypothetical protein ACETWB_09575 [Anaerolineae bacterium]
MHRLKRIVLCVGLIMSLVLIIGLVAWGRIAHWGQSAAGKAKWRARLCSIPFIIDEPRLHRLWMGARLEGPLMFHNQDGELDHWRFLSRRGDRIIGYVDIDAQSMVLLRFGWFYSDPNDLSPCPQHFPDPPTAEEAMDRAQDLLARYPDATVDTPFLYGVGGPYFWLIRVRRNGEVIASIKVWGERVWEIPPQFWEGGADW